MKDLIRAIQNPDTRDDCAMCGSQNIETKWERISFQYGSEESAPTLYATVPILKCNECESEFTDYKADMLCHEAVCRYLNVLTPSEIIEIRRKLNLTQAEMAELTGIGVASINRWEKGGLVQSSAVSNFLYLLGQKGNMQALLSKQNKSE